MKRILILLATTLAALALAGLRPDAAAASDTAAVAVNTKDGASVFRLAFAIKRAAGDVVDNSNAAVAFASCTDCQTVAISIQIVLITGDASVVTPTNLAIAFNYQCTLCDTLASAYQWVLTTDGQVHFTAEGNQAIAEIKRELRALRGSGLSGPEIQARVAELMRRLAQVVESELVAAGRSGGRAGDDDGDDDAGRPATTAPTTTATPTATTAPTTAATTTPTDATTTTTTATTTTTSP